MSHGYTSNDSCVSLFVEWHNLQTLKEKITYDESGLNWTVEKRKLKLADDDSFIIDGESGLFCPEKGVYIKTVMDSYGDIQNKQIFETIEDSLKGIDYRIVTCGSIQNLKKVYVSVELTEKQNYMVNRELFKNYMTFYSSHDESSTFKVYDTSIRVCCQNTLQWSLVDKGLLNLRVRHTSGSKLRIENMKEHIKQLFEKREEFYAQYEELTQREMELERAYKIATGFIGTDTLSAKARNQVHDVLYLFRNGKGNAGKTEADLFNAFTEYYTSRASDNKRKQYASSEFGSGRDKKLKAWKAFSDNELDALARRGEQLLKADK